MKPFLVALSASICLMAGQKQTAAVPGTTKHFQKQDADHDGRISLTEFQHRGDPAKRAKRFRKLDLNQDGYLSFDEFEAGKAAHAK